MALQRYQLLTADYVGGKLKPQIHENGNPVIWDTAHTPEWVGRNMYGQRLCREWVVRDLATDTTVACYPTNTDMGQPEAGTIREAMERQRRDRQGTGIQILALFRAALNQEGHDWSECVRIVDEIVPQVECANWVETDTGRTFDLSFEPKKK